MSSAFSKRPLSQPINWRTIKKIPDVNFWPLDMWETYTQSCTPPSYMQHTHNLLSMSISFSWFVHLVMCICDGYIGGCYEYLVSKHRCSGICSILTQIPVGVYLEVVQLDHVLVLFLVLKNIHLDFYFGCTISLAH